MTLALVTNMADLRDAGRRTLLGLRNDIGLTAQQVAAIFPDRDALVDAVKSRAVVVWIDKDDPEGRGVFVMRHDPGGWAGAGWYAVFGFGPSGRWLDYLEAVVDTFIAKGQGDESLFYPSSNPLGKFGADTLQSETGRGGIRIETANGAKAKIRAWRAAHP